MNNKTICPMRFAPALMTLTLALLTARPALAQHQFWIRQFGTSEVDITYGAAPDGAGGVMVTGYTWGSLGGPSAGVKDVFLARYDGAGNQLWIRQFGTRSYDRGLAIATDGARGVFVGGVTTGSLGGPYVGGGWDVFLARYDHAGNQIWIRQFGASTDFQGLSLAPDGAGGVMVAGPTDGSPGGPNAGSYDAFLARYDSAGNQLWIRQFGTSALDKATALAPDGDNGSFVAGYTGGDLGGPNAGFGWDAFLARYDSAGNQLWIRQFGTEESDMATGLAPDNAGGVIVAGLTSGSLGGPIAGREDGFLARYDGEGNQIWIRQFDTMSDYWPWALTPDGVGGVMVAGPFLARHDSNGNRLWIRRYFGSSGGALTALSAVEVGGVMVAGSTDGSLGGPNAGSFDVFLARYEIDSCYPDCDRSTGNGVLDIIDYLCFQNSFVTGDPFACDCDTSTGPGVCDISDFLCFQKAFMAGCP